MRPGFESDTHGIHAKAVVVLDQFASTELEAALTVLGQRTEHAIVMTGGLLAGLLQGTQRPI
jgi:hypothetical protein